MTLQQIGDAAVIFCGAISTASVAVHWTVRPRWWTNSWGMHLMAYMLVVAWILDLAAARVIAGAGLDSPWFVGTRLASYAFLLPGVLVWRLGIQCAARGWLPWQRRRAAHSHVPPDRAPGRVFTMSPGRTHKMVTTSWWQDLLARIGRQEAQTLLPVLAAAALAGGISGIDYVSLLSVAVITALVTGLRAVTGLRVSAAGPLWAQAADRAAAAFAGTALGLITAGPAFNIFTAPWLSILDVSAAAAALGVISMFTNPPPPLATQNPDGSYRIRTGS